MLIGVVVLSPPLAFAIRRIWASMPQVVARNYGGTTAVLAVSCALLGVGLLHHASVSADRVALGHAVARAEAWIAARAPGPFRGQVLDSSTYAIEPGSIYRVCAPDVARARTYCVVVKLQLPLARSVSFSGYEPNSVLSTGTG
jgi:hypothetical protein